MLTFFRKIRLALISKGAGRKYLLYALGEILLVMIGILLALQVNNWNQSRIESIEEESALLLLHNNLADQASQVNLALRISKDRLRSAFIVLEHMERNSTYHDSLNAHLREMTLEAPTPITINSAYEAIKDTNLSNDSLAAQVFELFEVRLPRIDSETANIPNITAYFKAYVLEHFQVGAIQIAEEKHGLNGLPYTDQVLKILDKKWFRPHFGYLPKDYETLVSDQTFKLMLKTSIEYRTWKIIQLENTKEVIHVTNEILKHELKLN